MSLEIDVWDAFTSGNKGGNRASVIFGMDLRRQDEMQHLAKDLGTPASVFVGEPVWENSVCSIKLRFFTPQIEEAICGHGTIAAVFACVRCLGMDASRAHLFDVETRMGKQNARFDAGVAWLKFPNPSVWTVDVDPSQIACALGLSERDFPEGWSILKAGVGRTKLVCMVRDVHCLDQIVEHSRDIKNLCIGSETTGLVVSTTPGRADCLTDTRHFSVQESVVEDSATGNAHAALAAYLAAHSFFPSGKRYFSGGQGYAMGQPSRLEVCCQVDAHRGRVSELWIGGVGMAVGMSP